WLLGRHMAVGVWLGSLIVNLAVGASWPLALAIATGNTCGALVAGELAKRARIDRELKSPGDVVVFSALLVGASTLVAATLGAASLWLFGGLPISHFAPTWIIWWLGDAGGVLVVTPLFIAFTRRKAPASKARAGELLALVVVSALSVWLAFGGFV